MLAAGRVLGPEHAVADDLVEALRALRVVRDQLRDTTAG